MMPSGVGPQSRGRKKSGLPYTTPNRDLESESPLGVRESSPKAVSGRKIETLLSDIVTRLDRIEEKIDENVYPPESAIRPEMIRKIKKAHADIKKGKGKTYNCVDDFFQEIEA